MPFDPVHWNGSSMAPYHNYRNDTYLRRNIRFCEWHELSVPFDCVLCSETLQRSFVHTRRYVRVRGKYQFRDDNDEPQAKRLSTENRIKFLRLDVNILRDGPSKPVRASLLRRPFFVFGIHTRISTANNPLIKSERHRFTKSCQIPNVTKIRVIFVIYSFSAVAVAGRFTRAVYKCVCVRVRRSPIVPPHSFLYFVLRASFSLLFASIWITCTWSVHHTVCVLFTLLLCFHPHWNAHSTALREIVSENLLRIRWPIWSE